MAYHCNELWTWTWAYWTWHLMFCLCIIVNPPPKPVPLYIYLYSVQSVHAIPKGQCTWTLTLISRLVSSIESRAIHAPRAGAARPAWLSDSELDCYTVKMITVLAIVLLTGPTLLVAQITCDCGELCTHVRNHNEKNCRLYLAHPPLACFAERSHIS